MSTLRTDLWDVDMDGGEDAGFSSVTHGDPHIDSFFFGGDEDSVGTGLFDWQQISIGHVGMDISWVLCVHDLATRYNRTATKLVNRYFKRLQSLGGAVGMTIEHFREDLALLHLVTMSRAIQLTHQNSSGLKPGS